MRAETPRVFDKHEIRQRIASARQPTGELSRLSYGGTAAPRFFSRALLLHGYRAHFVTLARKSLCFLGESRKSFVMFFVQKTRPRNSFVFFLAAKKFCRILIATPPGMTTKS